VTASEEFGTPEASDILLAIGDVYFSRGALLVAVRHLLSGIPPEQAITVLQSVIIELSHA